jgi:hypothetical protein
LNIRNANRKTMEMKVRIEIGIMRLRRTALVYIIWQ